MEILESEASKTKGKYLPLWAYLSGKSPEGVKDHERIEALIESIEANGGVGYAVEFSPESIGVKPKNVFGNRTYILIPLGEKAIEYLLKYKEKKIRLNYPTSTNDLKASMFL